MLAHVKEVIKTNNIINKDEIPEEASSTSGLSYTPQQTNVGETILNRDLTGAGDDITDITDGRMYKELKRAGILSERENFSLLWNTDGVPVFKSSQCSIWPVLTMINELPYDMRRRNILLTALWFGSSKPDMSVFLKPFIDECQTLSTTGLQWMYKRTQVTSKAFCLVCSVDSVARPMIQSMVQFNGFSGCGFCKHKGEYAERAMRYPYHDPPPVKRTDEEFKRTGILAQESGRVIEGVKGVSIVSLLLYFNIIWGFIPDYMHSVCLGTVRRFMNMWVDPANRSQEWYIGRWKEEINKRLKNLQVTREISRLPRSLKDIKFWKANEWRTFLYVSPIVLSGILPAKYLAHWCMLACAIFNLNQAKISKKRLMQSDFYLQKFAMFVDPLYGKQEATFNVHLLVHLTDSVRNWGPLWATSAFAFESFNGYIKTLYAGTRYLPQQIFQTLCYIQDLYRHLSLIESHKTFMYIEKMLNHNRLMKNVQKFGTDVTKLVCLGTGHMLNLSEPFKLALQEFLGEMLLVDSVTSYEKFAFRGSLYTTKEYSKRFRRNNSVVKVGNVLCEIINLVTFKSHMCQQYCDCKEHIALLVENLTTVRKFTCKQGTELGCTVNFISEVLRGEFMSIPYQNISGKCMLLETNQKEFVISLPNLKEGD
ncbi:uncharacterized protein [Diadema antillarum]|uniref:uncharacterized protein n=1 Tax=Diadema antillarum TaxID=105358 RepID=UPI003A87561F